jgi:hypothetical protein
MKDVWEPHLLTQLPEHRLSLGKGFHTVKSFSSEDLTLLKQTRSPLEMGSARCGRETASKAQNAILARTLASDSRLQSSGRTSQKTGILHQPA